MAGLRQTRKEGGLCVKCGEERGADGTETLCRKHADERAKIYATKVCALRRRRRKRRQCVVCGELLPKPKRGKKVPRLCDVDKILQNNYNRANRARNENQS